MNVLIIDDDRFVVSALEKKVMWRELGVERVYTAYNIRQARKVIEENTIQLMLCDIEMPQGSGLELLAWVRDEKLPIETIILTSFAEFDYAQDAVKLDCLDYLLKPVNYGKLTEIIQKAIKKIREQEKAKKSIVQQFWQELLQRETTDEKELLMRKVEQKQLDYREEETFILIFAGIYPGYDQTAEYTEAVLDFSFKNIWSEVFLQNRAKAEILIDLQMFYYLAVIRLDEKVSGSKAVKQILKSVMENLGRCMGYDSGFCMSKPVSLWECADTFEELTNVCSRDLFCRNNICEYPPALQKESAYAPACISQIEIFLKHNNQEQVLTAIRQYIQEQCQKKTFTYTVAWKFKRDVEQLVLSYLQEKEIEGHRLFMDEKSGYYEKRALSSIEDYQSCFEHMITRAVEYAGFAEKSKSVIDIVTGYIEKNYEQEINKKTLADIVYLNPDYLGKLFKKKTGISVNNYVMKVRVEKGKDLLANTDIPINVIALDTGFSNYSYYSKVFKELVGCTPNEYRKKME